LSGDDSPLFSLDSTSGELAFVEAADFEQPLDMNGDNQYQLTITASDGSLSDTLNLTVSVTNVTNVPIQVRRVALGLDAPIFATGAGDDSGRLFIVQQGGIIRILDLETETLLPLPFLDLSSQVSTGFEQGLLGLAFAPDYATSGLFFVYITNVAGDTEILEFSVDANNPNVADTSPQRLILTFNQPFANHNAGWIDFGQDGFLYIPTGDGGGAGDPQGNSQDTSNLLGSVLRINPFADDFPTDPTANYAIPADNPFLNTPARDEIFAYGLRNPFRSSFDRLTGDLYLGDVGQNLIEEIDLITVGESGLNFGWNIVEGTLNFLGSSTPNLTPPIAEYAHGPGPREGLSITGGYVHRGRVEALNGEYVFADFVNNNIWSIPVDSISQGTTITANEFIIRTDELTTPDLGAIASIASFGEDDDGELYIVDIFRNEIFRIENDDS